MKKIILIALFAALTVSCTYVLFGGRVVGPYIRHYKGQMECAFVEGWFQNRACMCWMSDRSFGPDVTFLHLNDEMCEKVFE